MSAKRFGGAYSPGAAQQARGSARAVRTPPDPAAWSMFVLPTPLLFAALATLGTGGVFRAGAMLAAYALLLLAAWLLREGQRAEAAFAAREMARPPFPRKIAAAGACAAGVGLAAAMGWGLGLGGGIGFAIVAGGAHLVAFGLDPLRAKGIAQHGIDGRLAAKALAEARARLARIEGLLERIDDREITGRVEALLGSVEEMLAVIERDPRDLERARRYLTVYLKGAEDATRKFADDRDTGGDADGAMRRSYLAMVGELEASFARGREKLLQDDRTDLEIEIEVLRERLAQERA